jgi:hypothetical protein
VFQLSEALEILAKRNSTFATSKAVAKYMARPHIYGHICAGIQERGHSCVPGHTVGNASHVQMSFRDTNAHTQVIKSLRKREIVIDQNGKIQYAYEITKISEQLMCETKYESNGIEANLKIFKDLGFK